MATSDQERRPSYGFSAFKEEDFLEWDRGSLLKVCCVAACLLSGREKDIHLLTSAVDQIMIGAVLMDHFYLFGYLEKGRYNAFIAYCSDQNQSQEYQISNKQAVLRAIYLEQRVHLFSLI